MIQISIHPVGNAFQSRVSVVEDGKTHEVLSLTAPSEETARMVCTCALHAILEAQFNQTLITTSPPDFHTRGTA